LLLRCINLPFMGGTRLQYDVALFNEVRVALNWTDDMLEW